MSAGLLERGEELDVPETALRRAATGSGSVSAVLQKRGVTSRRDAMRAATALGTDTTGANP